MKSTFKKGQSINIKGVIGIVLDNGMNGGPFRETYAGKLVRWYWKDKRGFITAEVGISMTTPWIAPTTSEVLYTVMIGDEKGWVYGDDIKQI